MKLNCEIVQDLIPLYLDDVCSEVSRKAVQEHLRECESCRALLKDTQNLPILEVTAEAPTQDQAVKRSFKKVRRRWKLSLLAVLMILPLALLGVLSWNQAHGTGICFTNLDDIWNCSQFVSALESGSYEKAAAYINYDTIYDECQEALSMQPEDFMADYQLVTIGDETFMAYTWFAERYLSDTTDVQNTWRYLIYNGITEAMIPEDIWYAVTDLGEESPIPDGTCYRLPTGYCYYRLETQWGNFMVTDTVWDNLQQLGNDPIYLTEMVAILPEEIYWNLKPELEARAQENVDSIRQRHENIIGMDREEFAVYMEEYYIQRLASLETQGYTFKGLGFRDAYFDSYYPDRWVVSYAAQVSGNQGTRQFSFEFDLRQGKIYMVGASHWGGSIDWLDTVLDTIRPNPH